MGKLSQRAGNEFNREMERLFHHISPSVNSWDDHQIPATLRPADVQTCIDGLSVRCECKTFANKKTLDFNVIGDKKYYDPELGERKGENRQRFSLMSHALAGGLSLIAIKRRQRGKPPRHWLISWQHWEAERRRLYPQLKSLPLDDKRRATSLHEVARFYFDEPISRITGTQIQELKNLVLAIHEEAKGLPIWDYRFDKWAKQ